MTHAGRHAKVGLTPTLPRDGVARATVAAVDATLARLKGRVLARVRRDAAASHVRVFARGDASERVRHRLDEALTRVVAGDADPATLEALLVDLVLLHTGTRRPPGRPPSAPGQAA